MKNTSWDELLKLAKDLNSSIEKGLKDKDVELVNTLLSIRRTISKLAEDTQSMKETLDKMTLTFMGADQNKEGTLH